MTTLGDILTEPHSSQHIHTNGRVGGGDRSEEQKKVDKEQDEKLSIEIARSTETDALQDKKISDMEGKLDAASSYETDEGGIG